MKTKMFMQHSNNWKAMLDLFVFNYNIYCKSVNINRNSKHYNTKLSLQCILDNIKLMMLKSNKFGNNQILQ